MSPFISQKWYTVIKWRDVWPDPHKLGTCSRNVGAFLFVKLPIRAGLIDIISAGTLLIWLYHWLAAMLSQASFSTFLCLTFLTYKNNRIYFTVWGFCGLKYVMSLEQYLAHSNSITLSYYCFYYYNCIDVTSIFIVYKNGTYQWYMLLF